MMPALLALAFTAAADPSPRQVIERSKGGRVAYIRALSDVERFAPRLPSKERLFPYIDILDELEAVGRRYDLAGMGLDPVKDLGEILTYNAEKWLRLDRDPPATVASFMKWSATGTRVTAAADAAVLAAEASSPESLLAWSRGCDQALARLKAVKADHSAIQAFAELQGVIARLILARSRDFDPSELTHAIRRISTAPGLSELLAFLEIEAGAARGASDLKRILEWGVLAAQGARGLGPAAPLRLRVEAGAVVLEALSRIFFEGYASDPSLVDTALEVLTSRQRGEFLSRFGSANRL